MVRFLNPFLILCLIHISIQFKCDFDDEEFIQRYYGGDNSTRSVRSLPRNIDQIKWINGVVKYEWDSSITQEDKNVVLGAFREYETRTCVRYQERTSNDRTGYTRIIRDDNTCASNGGCGRQGVHEVRFSQGCRSVQILVHELLHNHCYPHEQHRPDRDAYVTYPRDKCPNGGPGKCEDCQIRESLYDYVSIVSDGCYQCTHVGWPTMPGIEKCGGDVSRTLSVMDVDKLNELYDCGGCYRHRWRAIENANNIPQEDMVYFATLPNGGKLSPCRGYWNGEVIVGKYWHPARTCWVSWGGEEHALKERAQIFTVRGGNLNQSGANYRLVDKNQLGNGNKPVPGGRTAKTVTGYIAVAEFGGESAIGKKWDNEGHATFPVNGGERHADNYKVLTCG